MTNKSEENTFSNILEIVSYLKATGWRVSKSTVYNHVKEGRLRPGKDGKYKSSVVDKYAVYADLPRMDGSTSRDRIAEEKQRAENRKALAQAEHWELKTKIAQGLYVPRESFERELAQRAMIFKADIESFCRAQAGIIVSLVDGDKDKTPDLIDYMLSAAAGWLNRYSADREFTVPAPAADAVLQDPDEDRMEDEPE